jgi:hypothetical protein
MNRNALYVVIGGLVVVVAVLGFYFYQERQTTTRVEINVGKDGLSIEKK